MANFLQTLYNDEIPWATADERFMHFYFIFLLRIKPKGPTLHTGYMVSVTYITAFKYKCTCMYTLQFMGQKNPKPIICDNINVTKCFNRLHVHVEQTLALYQMWLLWI